MVTDLYEGKMVDYLSCQSCTFERRRTEAFRELELEIGIPTVLQSLNAYASVWYIVSAGPHPQVVSPCAGIRARNCCPATTSGSALAVTRKWTQPRASSCKMSHPSSHYTSSGTRGVHPWAAVWRYHHGFAGQVLIRLQLDAAREAQQPLLLATLLADSRFPASHCGGIRGERGRRGGWGGRRQDV